MILSEASEKILDGRGTGKWDGWWIGWWIAWRGSSEQLRAGSETSSTGTGAAGSKSQWEQITFHWSARCVCAHVIHSFKSSALLSYVTNAWIKYVFAKKTCCSSVGILWGLFGGLGGFLYLCLIFCVCFGLFFLTYITDCSWQMQS